MQITDHNYLRAIGGYMHQGIPIMLRLFTALKCFLKIVGFHHKGIDQLPGGAAKLIYKPGMILLRLGGAGQCSRRSIWKARLVSGYPSCSSLASSSALATQQHFVQLSFHLLLASLRANSWKQRCIFSCGRRLYETHLAACFTLCAICFSAGLGAKQPGNTFRYTD